MIKRTSDLESMDYKYVVQIQNSLEHKWIDVALFKDISHAEDFLQAQLLKSVQKTDDLEGSMDSMSKYWRINKID